MNSHKNALLNQKGRELMVRAVVDDGLSVVTVARLYRTTPKTVAKWVARFRAEGIDGLRDRSSRPHSSPNQTPPPTCAAIEASRRQGHSGRRDRGSERSIYGSRNPDDAPFLFNNPRPPLSEEGTEHPFESVYVSLMVIETSSPPITRTSTRCPLCRRLGTPSARGGIVERLSLGRSGNCFPCGAIEQPLRGIVDRKERDHKINAIEEPGAAGLEASRTHCFRRLRDHPQYSSRT